MSSARAPTDASDGHPATVPELPIDPDDLEPEDERPPTRVRPPRHHHFDLVGAVAAGGALGTLARYELTEAFPVAAGGFPVTILVINLVGSFVLGVLLIVLVERMIPSRYARAFLGVGVIGGFTTFSSFAVDTIELARTGHLVTAAAFFVVSVVGGLAAGQLGVVVGRSRLTSRP